MQDQQHTQHWDLVNNIRSRIALKTASDIDIMHEVEDRGLYPGVSTVELTELMYAVADKDWDTVTRITTFLAIHHLGRTMP